MPANTINFTPATSTITSVFEFDPENSMIISSSKTLYAVASASFNMPAGTQVRDLTSTQLQLFIQDIKQSKFYIVFAYQSISSNRPILAFTSQNFITPGKSYATGNSIIKSFLIDIPKEILSFITTLNLNPGPVFVASDVSPPTIQVLTTQPYVSRMIIKV